MNKRRKVNLRVDVGTSTTESETITQIYISFISNTLITLLFIYTYIFIIL